MRSTPSILDRIVGAIDAGVSLLTRRHSHTDKLIHSLLILGQANGRKLDLLQQSTTSKLDQILSILLEPAAIAGTVLLFEGESMTPSADFTFTDDGKALLTVSFVDSIKEPTSPVSGATISTAWTSSDSNVTVTDRGDGLNADVALITPAPTSLPTDVTITAVTTVTNPDGTVLGPFTSTSQPIDVIAGPIAGTVLVVAAE